ncbi:hypothetical protein ACFL3I_14060, partial [Pseudomonadota bacterium]
MENRKTLALLFVAAIASIGMSIGSAFAATPGTWDGTADFGTFELVVNTNGSGIEKINYSFLNWTCGPVTKSGSPSATQDPAWPISDDEFSFTNYLDPGNNEEITISGLFESATQASGTWQAVMYGTNCEGTWQASNWQPAPSMTIVKTSDTVLLSSPQMVTYDYLVSNTGNLTLTGLALADDNDNDDAICDSTTLTVAPDAGSTTICHSTHTFTQAELEAWGSPNPDRHLCNNVVATTNEAPPANTRLCIPIEQNPSMTIVKTSDTVLLSSPQ